MFFEKNQVYHLYNRGNNKQRIFFTSSNYLFFLQKVKKEWTKHCAIICYCLMPNHFHFMLVPNEEGCKNISLGGKVTHLQNLSRVIGKSLKSYTQAINIQNKTTGNLFQKKTKAKLITEERKLIDKFTRYDYLNGCFHYIHQNPLKAKLVIDLKNWPYSYYPDFYSQRNGTIVSKILAMKILDLSDNDFLQDSKVAVNFEITERIF